MFTAYYTAKNIDCQYKKYPINKFLAIRCIKAKGFVGFDKFFLTLCFDGGIIIVRVKMGGEDIWQCQIHSTQA